LCSPSVRPLRGSVKQSRPHCLRPRLYPYEPVLLVSRCLPRRFVSERFLTPRPVWRWPVDAGGGTSVDHFDLFSQLVGRLVH
jgi:hypothetical protein